jgi:MFS family permease
VNVKADEGMASATESDSAFAPLRHTTFRNIWLASLASNFGTLIQSVGAAWLMTSLANSVDMVALVQTSTTLPIMLLSLFGGAVADSYDRRKVMLFAQCFMLVVSVALAVFTWMGLMGPWLLLAFTFLVGCGTALNNPSWQASVGDMVPRRDLPAAVALNSVGFNLCRSVGPAIGGLIVAIAGAGAAFAINAASYVGIVGVLFRWHPERPHSSLPREPIGPAMLSGLRYVAMSPNIGKVLLRAFVFGLSATIVLALLPVIASTLLGGGPLTYGLMLGAFGVGAVGGALLSNRMHLWMSAEWVVRIAFAGFAVCVLVSGVSTAPWLTGAAMFVGGACWVLALAHFNVSVQLLSPRWVEGRTLSVYQTVSFGGMSLGAWIWGLVADTWSIEIALLASAIPLLIGIALGLVLPLPRRTAINLDPLNRFKEPRLELELLPRSGPIRVEIAYRIATEDIPRFLAVMADRKRIRRRDGARHWMLARDLGDPTVWVETYNTPTWTEYVRHNLRRTHADAEIGARIRALHRGEGAPQVRRFIERPTNWLRLGGHGGMES